MHQRHIRREGAGLYVEIPLKHMVLHTQSIW